MKIFLFSLKSPCGFPLILLLTRQGPGKTVRRFCDQQSLNFSGVFCFVVHIPYHLLLLFVFKINFVFMHHDMISIQLIFRDPIEEFLFSFSDPGKKAKLFERCLLQLCRKIAQPLILTHQKGRKHPFEILMCTIEMMVFVSGHTGKEASFEI